MSFKLNIKPNLLSKNNLVQDTVFNTEIIIKNLFFLYSCWLTTHQNVIELKTYENRMSGFFYNKFNFGKHSNNVQIYHFSSTGNRFLAVKIVSQTASLSTLLH